jgi:hypothetical protein
MTESAAAYPSVYQVTAACGGMNCRSTARKNSPTLGFSRLPSSPARNPPPGGREVAQLPGLGDDSHAGQVASPVGHPFDDLDHVVHVALGVGAAGDGEADQVHRGWGLGAIGVGREVIRCQGEKATRNKGQCRVQRISVRVGQVGRLHLEDPAGARREPDRLHQADRRVVQLGQRLHGAGHLQRGNQRHRRVVERRRVAAAPDAQPAAARTVRPARRLSCTGPAACVAVGTDGRTLAEIWAGAHWQITPTPSP